MCVGIDLPVIDLLETFQAGIAALIVGVLGFAGVIITLVVNARITRSHAREARGHERENLARALLTELSSHRRCVKKNVEDMKAGTGTTGELLVPAIRASTVFDANVSHLGRLSGVQIGPVLEAYLMLKEFNRSLVLFSTPDSSGDYRIVGGQHLQQVRSLLHSLLPHFDAAIAALDGAKDCKAVRHD